MVKPLNRDRRDVVLPVPVTGFDLALEAYQRSCMQHQTEYLVRTKGSQDAAHTVRSPPRSDIQDVFLRKCLQASVKSTDGWTDFLFATIR